MSDMQETRRAYMPTASKVILAVPVLAFAIGLMASIAHEIYKAHAAKKPDGVTVLQIRRDAP
jgi:hypothetical protein